MRALFRIALVSSLLVWCAMAQRGGHGGGGGFHGGGSIGGHGSIGGGGFHGGGGFSGGRSIGGSFGAIRGGVGGFGFNRGGFGGFNRGYGYGYGYRGWGYPYYGWGYGMSYWPGYYDYWDYPGYGSGYYPDAYAYNTSPNVTVVYPQTVAGDPPPAYSQSAHPMIRSYDEYGQETHPTANGAPSSPIYLIAMKDGVIYAASSYSVENGTLHYVTLQHEEKTVPVSSIDRTLTNQLNRERRVNLNLGQ